MRATRSKPASGFDLEFRLRSYFWPMAADIHVLGRISGTRRRQIAAELLAAGHDPSEVEHLADNVLPDQERNGLMAIHPGLSGGEYLPPLGLDEVEIARVNLIGSVLGDVISVRARRSKDGIAYSIVDEHEMEYQPGISSSEQPLKMRELIDLLETSEPALGIGFLEGSMEVGVDLDDLENFMRVESLFYPQLEAWYEQQTEQWLAEKAREIWGDHDEEEEEDSDVETAHEHEPIQGGAVEEGGESVLRGDMQPGEDRR
jgi:hypothetical protein